MAWGLVTDSQGIRVSTPLTLSFNWGATSKLLTVSIWTNGIVARTGNGPTYNGVTMTDSGNGFIAHASGECGTEVFYLTTPYTGGAANIVVPNTNSVSINISAAAWSTSNIAAKDQTSSATGLTQNPSLVVNSVVANAMMYGSLASGDRDAPTAGTNYTLLNTEDVGNQTWGDEYDLDTGSAGNITVSFATARADDWGLIGIAFKDSSSSSSTSSTTSSSSSGSSSSSTSSTTSSSTTSSCTTSPSTTS